MKFLWIMRKKKFKRYLERVCTDPNWIGLGYYTFAVDACPLATYVRKYYPKARVGLYEIDLYGEPTTFFRRNRKMPRWARDFILYLTLRGGNYHAPGISGNVVSAEQCLKALKLC